MRFVAIIAVVAIIALAIVLTSVINGWRRGATERLRIAVEQRNLARNQLDVAKAELRVIVDLSDESSLPAQLALEEIERLQRAYDDKRELEDLA